MRGDYYLLLGNCWTASVPKKTHFDKTLYSALADKIGLLDSKSIDNSIQYYRGISKLEYWLRLLRGKENSEILKELAKELATKGDLPEVHKRGEKLIKSLEKQLESLAFSKTYLFSWDNVPGDDNERLLMFLSDDLDIEWAEDAEITKSDDGKTIRILKDENAAEIIVDEKKEKATLKIRDAEKTHDLKVKMENGKLNIYSKTISRWFFTLRKAVSQLF